MQRAQYPRPNPEVVSDEGEGEVVVVTPQDGSFHTLNPAASWLWRHADGQRSLADLAQGLCDAFAVEPDMAEADVAAFAARAIEAGLWTLDERPPEPPPDEG